MSKQQVPRALLTEAAQAAAGFGAAAGAVDEAAAAAFGVNRTDLRIIGLLHQAGALSAGRLSAAAGLSPAATSTAIQRLMAAGYLTRGADGKDRRRAVLTLTPPAAGLLSEIYAPVGEAGLRELNRYSAAEIKLITEFLRRGERLQISQAGRIRSLACPAASPAGDPSATQRHSAARPAPARLDHNPPGAPRRTSSPGNAGMSGSPDPQAAARVTR